MRKLLGKTVTTEMLQAGQDAWLNDPTKRSSVLWEAMFEAAPDHSEELVEAIAEEVALFERGSRATLGWHIKRALMGEGMHGASSAEHLGNTLATDEVGSIPTSPAYDDVVKAIADALPDTWRHEAFMDLVNIAAKAALSHPNKHEALPAKQVMADNDLMRKALVAVDEQIERNSFFNSCDVPEDDRCSACGATSRMDRGKGNRGWKMEHSADCAWVLLDKALTTQSHPKKPVDGKPLELMTRDELLWYIESQKLPSEDEAVRVMLNACVNESAFGSSCNLSETDAKRAYRALIALMERK